MSESPLGSAWLDYDQQSSLVVEPQASGMFVYGVRSCLGRTYRSIIRHEDIHWAGFLN